MKRLVSILLLIVSIFTLAVLPTVAEERRTEITYYEDGSYCVTEIIIAENAMNRAISTKTGTKTNTYYSATGNTLFSLSVRGTFNYNGTVARATASSYSYSITSSAWDFVSGSSSYTANRATATGTFENSLGSEKTLSVTLYCDQDGNLS